MKLPLAILEKFSKVHMLVFKVLYSIFLFCQGEKIPFCLDFKNNFFYFFLGILQSNGTDLSVEEIAIKVPKLSNFSTDSVRDFYDEAKTALQFNHENVLRCWGISMGKNHITYRYIDPSCHNFEYYLQYTIFPSELLGLLSFEKKIMEGDNLQNYGGKDQYIYLMW